MIYFGAVYNLAVWTIYIMLAAVSVRELLHQSIGSIKLMSYFLSLTILPKA